MRFSDDPLRGIALIMSVTCVRNTIIEKYHADGKLDDHEMEAFNRQVADRIYTFLTYLMAHPREASDLIDALRHYFPTNWDPPQRDASIDRAVEAFRARIRTKR